MAKDCAICETVNGMTDGPLCKRCLRSWQGAFGSNRGPTVYETNLMRWAAQVAFYGRAPRRSSRTRHPTPEVK